MPLSQIETEFPADVSGAILVIVPTSSIEAWDMSGGRNNAMVIDMEITNLNFDVILSSPT